MRVLFLMFLYAQLINGSTVNPPCMQINCIYFMSLRLRLNAAVIYTKHVILPWYNNSCHQNIISYRICIIISFTTVYSMVLPQYGY